MKCIQCGADHERKGMYCSKNCTDKAYRERKKNAIAVPEEKGEKLKWCNFCGKSIEQSPKLAFCNDEHEKDYWRTIRDGGTLKIKVDSRTEIQTRKYYRVQEIVEAMVNRGKYGVTYF